MLLSCVKRAYDKLGYYVGLTVLARTLRGSQDARVLQLGLDTLSTYGLLRGKSRAEIRAIAEHLVSEGYLQTDGEHQAVQLTPQAAQVLYHGKTVCMPVRKEPEEGPGQKTQTQQIQLSGNAADLYDELRILRGELAQKAGIPAYVVFSNATLQEMAIKKPKNRTEFKRISGVGELKASWYADTFLKRIKKFLETQ